MEDHVYKVLELVGSSEKSIEDAIQNAIILLSQKVARFDFENQLFEEIQV